MINNYIYNSNQFSLSWYLSEYPDVGKTGIEPLDHYLRYGALLGRDPSACFSTNWYLSEYSDVAESGMNPLLHYLQYGRLEGRSPKPNRAIKLDNLLWAGEETATLLKLKSLLSTSDANEQEISYALWSMARWYAWEGCWDIVYTLLHRFVRIENPLPYNSGPYLLYVDALIKTLRFKQADSYLEILITKSPGYADFYLAMSNLIFYINKKTLNDISKVNIISNQHLALINKIYDNKGIGSLSISSESLPLSLDNLQVKMQEPIGGVYDNKLLISIIVPVYNSEKTLSTAIQSILEQTWANIEVLIIDDASIDSSLNIAESFASQDSRVRVISQSYNQGAYAARNAGLALATGDFITTHDADDWSHPEKIEKQVRVLVDNEQYVASTSHWVRCTTELEFGRWRIEEGWTYRNVSSLMFRRSVFNQLGFWDRVTINADTEYYYRIIRAFGMKSMCEVLPGLPLAFGRHSPESLSQNSETHLRTQFIGLRKSYHDAALKWHGSIEDISKLYLPLKPAQRPFPAPNEMICGGPKRMDAHEIENNIVQLINGTDKEIQKKIIKKIPVEQEAELHQLQLSSNKRLDKEKEQLKSELDILHKQLAIRFDELAKLTLMLEDRDNESKIVSLSVHNQVDKKLNRKSVSRLITSIVKKPKSKRLNRHIRLIYESGLFDKKWYLFNNPDVAVSNVDPLIHFIRNGGAEGRSPSAAFDAGWYLTEYMDVKEAGVNPLIHYIQFGKVEGRMMRAVANTTTAKIAEV